MINWKVRLKNKQFWLLLIPAVLLLVQVIAVPFGYDFKIEVISKQLLDIVNAVFVVLTILGIVNDPTTHGIQDSTQVLDYEKPRKDRSYELRNK